MDKNARHNDLLELLGRSERLSVEDAAAKLGVSPATIRRDFDELAQQQMLLRTRGGAKVNAVTYELPLRYKMATRAAEKQRIAAAVASLIPAQALIGMNGGTTVTEVARAIAARSAQNHTYDGQEITIVTNALNIAHELIVRPNVKVVLTGGVAWDPLESTCRHASLSIL